MRMKFLNIVLIISFLMLGCPQIALADRDIPDDNLSYPIKITIKKGVNTFGGSGFYYNDGKSYYLITAKHVLFDADENDTSIQKLKANSATVVSYSRDIKDKQKNQLKLNLSGFEDAQKIKCSNSFDIAAILIGKIRKKEDGDDFIEFDKNIKIESLAKEGLLSVSSGSIKKINEVLVGNEAIIFGYPTSIGLNDIPQIDYGRPLLRKGVIAGINERLKTIILDAPMYGGNSGGPVIEIEKLNVQHTQFNIIGLVIQFVPFPELWKNKTLGYSYVHLSNSGYSVVVSMDVVIDVIESLDNQM